VCGLVLASPLAISPQVSPTFYNQFTAAASVQKTFNRAFVLTGFSAQTTTFDNSPNFPVSRNGTIYTVPVRVGYYVTPQIYAFADPSADWRRYDNTAQLRRLSGHQRFGNQARPMDGRGLCPLPGGEE
jgi:hypothetical protein